MAVADVGLRNRYEHREEKPSATGDDTSDSGVDRGALSDRVQSMQQLLQRQKAQKLKAKAEELESRFLQQLTAQFRDVMHDFVTNAEQTLGDATTPESNGRALDATSKRRPGELPEKDFTPRDSVLSELLDINHIRTVYNIFAAILILFSIQTLTHDLLEKGRVVLDFDLLFYAFGKFPLVLFIWLVMALGAATVYPAFHYWAHNGQANCRRYNALALTAYVLLQLTMLVLPVKHVIMNDLPPVSSMIVTLEQIRLMMKVHAFVRENAPRVMHYHKQSGQHERGAVPCPDFTHYLYFMFAPTLVYRDRYPRTAKINWQFVASNIFQVVVCIFYTYYIFERFCVPVFRNFSHEHLTPQAFLLAVFGCMMPGALVLLIAFFAVLHSWLNAFAEMLRFADRLFYRDWWNSTSFANYYRTWNIVVHDWLYAYVYKDLHVAFGKSYRWAAMLLTFLLSAVFHEYVIVMTLGFFYPVLFVMFGGIGCLYNFISGSMFGMRGARTLNIIIWLQLFSGTGLLMSLYSMEWYARRNCSSLLTGEYRYVDYLVPRSWFCQ